MSEKPSGMNIGITSYKSVFQVQSNLSSILYMYSLFTVSKALESENEVQDDRGVQDKNLKYLGQAKTSKQQITQIVK